MIEKDWIPCSESLPEDGQYVLTTSRWKDIDICGFKLNDTKLATGKSCSTFNAEYTYFTINLEGEEDEIIAWMDLPEPYDNTKLNK